MRTGSFGALRLTRPNLRLGLLGWATVIAAVLLGLMNAIVRPVLVLLTLPITIVTLGLFLIVINAAMLGLVAALLADVSIAARDARIRSYEVQGENALGQALSSEQYRYQRRGDDPPPEPPPRRLKRSCMRRMESSRSAGRSLPPTAFGRSSPPPGRPQGLSPLPPSFPLPEPPQGPPPPPLLSFQGMAPPCLASCR